MYCTKCGNQLKAGTLFCSSCGNQTGAQNQPQQPIQQQQPQQPMWQQQPQQPYQQQQSPRQPFVQQQQIQQPQYGYQQQPGAQQQYGYRQSTTMAPETKKKLIIGGSIAAGVIVLLLIVLNLGGGGSLVGRWEGVSVTATFLGETYTETLPPGEAFWEINEDGTGAMIEGRGAGRENFTWRTEGGQFHMTESWSGETISARYSISGSTLRITMEEFGQTIVMTFRRVR